MTFLIGLACITTLAAFLILIGYIIEEHKEDKLIEGL